MKKNEIATAFKNNMLTDGIYKFQFNWGDKKSMKEVKEFLKMLNGECK